MTIDDLKIFYCALIYWSGVRGKLTPAMLKLMFGKLGMGLLNYKQSNLIVTTKGSCTYYVITDRGGGGQAK